MTVFLDPFTPNFEDPDHSADERRFVTLGVSDRGRVLFVPLPDGEEDQVRIIRVPTRTIPGFR
jgi:uncharacterized DUF497 family protein